MEDNMITPLSKVESVSIPTSPLRRSLEVAKSSIQPAVTAGASDSLLFFGLQGVGNTLLAKSLGQWVYRQLPDYDAVFIDCKIAAVIPDVKGLRVSRYVKPWVGDLNVIERTPDQGRILVLDAIESLSRQEQHRIRLLLLNWIIQATSKQHVPSIVIATSANPGQVDAAILNRIAKRIYVPATALKEMPNWLEAGGVGRDLAQEVTHEVEELVRGLNVRHIAPENLLDCLNTVLEVRPELPSVEPKVFAQNLCSTSTDFIVDSKLKEEYEHQFRYLIHQSSLLQDVSAGAPYSAINS